MNWSQRQANFAIVHAWHNAASLLRAARPLKTLRLIDENRVLENSYNAVSGRTPLKCMVVNS